MVKNGHQRSVVTCDGELAARLKQLPQWDQSICFLDNIGPLEEGTVGSVFCVDLDSITPTMDIYESIDRALDRGCRISLLHQLTLSGVIGLLERFPNIQAFFGKDLGERGNHSLLMVLNELKTHHVPDDIAHCFDGPFAHHHFEIEKDASKYEILAKIRETVEIQSLTPDFTDGFLTSIDEVITNALKHGRVPAAPAGSLAGDATQAIPLQTVKVNCGWNSDLLALSVQDSGGKLTRRRYVESLRQALSSSPDEQVRMKKGSAGVGLYLVHSLAKDVYVTVRPGLSTVVLVVQPISKRARDQYNGVHSIMYAQDSQTQGIES